MNSALIAFATAGAMFAAGPPKPKKPDIVTTIMPAEASRSITYSERDIPTIRTRLHYTTVIVLPKSENIRDFVCGDSEAWTINGADGTNFAYIKPEKAGARTNLNLVTASGNVYSFLIVEGDGQPDLKVFVETKDVAMVAAQSARPKWVTMLELDAERQKVEDAEREVDKANDKAHAAEDKANKSVAESGARADRDIATFRRGFPSSLKYDYDFKDKRQFGVHAIAHNKEFTYIWADPAETPSLYEVKDGKPNLTSFDYENGVYIVQKILDSGYLAIGKRRLQFKRED